MRCLKEPITFIETEPKVMEIHELTDKEFKIIIIRMLIEFKDTTQNNKSANSKTVFFHLLILVI